MKAINKVEMDLCPNIIYYNDDHSNTHKCLEKLNSGINISFSLPSTWHDLIIELEKDAKFLAFHVDMIEKPLHSTPIEFINSITTIARFIPTCKNLKIAVIIKPTTPLSVIRTLQKCEVQGILLDLNYYSIEDCMISADAFINNILYWPKQILSKLPGNIKTTANIDNINLTTRQEQVFRFIIERGSSNKVIAKSLGISESAVKLHVTGILRKYGAKNRTQLAVFSKVIS